MSDSIYSEAHQIGVFVSQKVARLQAALLGSGPGSTAARALLARLRKLDKPSGGVWATAGSELFVGLPEICFSRGDERRMLAAVKTSLKLYALHQQSRQQPMALVAKDSDQGEGTVRRSFGWSCRAIEYDLENATGVVRRLASLESARDFAGIENGLRGLIQLMRAHDVPVDYYQLARDLYLLQLDSCRSDVFMRWSRDYYRGGARREKASQGTQVSEERES